MALILLLTDAPDGAEQALPALGLLRHAVTTRPAAAGSLLAGDPCDLVLVDATGSPASARALCRVVAEAATAPVVLVLDDRALSLVDGSWGGAALVHRDAGPVEVDARLRMAAEATPAPGAGAATGPSPEQAVHVGPLEVDPETWSARLRGRPLDLTFKEFELLRHLAQHVDRVHTREQLLEAVWGDDYYGGTRTVDVHVRRVRAKLGPEHEGLIATVRNVGYRMTAPAAARP